MPHRVQNILLVSNLYETFILERDGQLSELLLSEFLELNLQLTPALIRVSSGSQALSVLESRPIDLVITGLQVGDMRATELATRIRDRGFQAPIVLLGHNHRELKEFVSREDVSHIQKVFLWQGDVGIMLAIVKYIEDRLNTPHDAESAGVQVIILIEDNIRYYSSFLPLIYSELFLHSQSVLTEGVNMTHKILRMRARPKILLCSTFEEAWDHFQRFSEVILGVISDIEFPRHGKLDPEAGGDFARQVRSRWPDVPILLQSSRPENEATARALGASFLLKNSPTLLGDLQKFMVDNFGFGDFVFRLPDGREVDRAKDLRGLLRKLRVVPSSSICYHASKNHFSTWLKARTEFVLAQALRPRKVSEYETIEDMRRYLIRAIEDYRREQQQGVISDFEADVFDPTEDFARIGGGSLGGKARGLAFARYLLNNYPVGEFFDGVRISVPPAVVLATNVFDAFLDHNQLRDFALNSRDEQAVRERFLAAEFPLAAKQHLGEFIDLVSTPLAVRSSSLLEDSQYQPFTGVYATYMLRNNHSDRQVRLHELITTIKLVYASTFSTHARDYIRSTPYRLEEEKMAVIIMKVVGAARGDRFYPDFAGVVRSHNFYPTAPLKAEDGIASVALGLGSTVVEGQTSLQFSPKHPRHIVQLSTVEDVLQNTQRTFRALRIGGEDPWDPTHPAAEEDYGLDVAEADGTLSLLGSVYSPENHAVYDGLSRDGVRVVSFAPILKHGIFPLAHILEVLLDLGSWGMNSPVEIEFAVNLAPEAGNAKEFGFLQVRPLALARETSALDLGDLPSDQLVCRSRHVLGNGVHEVHDLIVVDYHRFERERSQEVAQEVARLNAHLVEERRSYVLIGVGRWGSSDPWLGIPVTWDQISGARAIVESSFRDLKVTPSQGTHFFQNLTSFDVGYFTVNDGVADEFVNWDWLTTQPAAESSECVRHLVLEHPAMIKMNGARGEGLITQPQEPPEEPEQPGV
ncbi:MAG: histidine kinase [Planctomycetes bacterium]|nr:histidine kinase [Planctomycetota bacterium]